MTNRFVVSTYVTPEQKKRGTRAEVVDRTHPSDGGPVMIADFKTIEEANRFARVLNDATGEM